MVLQDSYSLHGMRWQGEVELGIIRILVAPHSKSLDDLPQQFHVDVKKHGDKIEPCSIPHCSSQDAKQCLPPSSFGICQQEGAEPPQSSAINSQLGQQIQKDFMVNSIKIQQDQQRGIASV